MRLVRVSKTFVQALDSQLAFGEPIYGDAVIAAKRAAVRATLQRLAEFPQLKQPHPELGLVIYPVARTPFAILYDFDEIELRAHFIFHKSASLSDLDPTSAQW